MTPTYIHPSGEDPAGDGWNLVISPNLLRPYCLSHQSLCPHSSFFDNPFRLKNLPPFLPSYFFTLTKVYTNLRNLNLLSLRYETFSGNNN